MTSWNGIGLAGDRNQTSELASRVRPKALHHEIKSAERAEGKFHESQSRPARARLSVQIRNSLDRGIFAGGNLVEFARAVRWMTPITSGDARRLNTIVGRIVMKMAALSVLFYRGSSIST